MLTHITHAPTRARRTRVRFLLLIAALAGTGCSDRTSPTAPDTGEIAGADDPTSVKRSRTPYISSLQVHSNAVFLAANGGYIGLDIVVMNPGPKTGVLHFAGGLRQGALGTDTDGMLVHCPELDGTMRHGTCTMRIELSVPPTAFTAGPAQFTLKLLRFADNDNALLDERVVDVTVVRL